MYKRQWRFLLALCASVGGLFGIAAGAAALVFHLAGINLFLSSLFTVGLPYLVKVHLSLSDPLYGFAEAAMGMGLSLIHISFPLRSF